MGYITLFWAINVLFQNGVITGRSIHLRKISSCFLQNQGKWIRIDQVAFSEPGFSTNMTNSSMKKKEKLVANISNKISYKACGRTMVRWRN
jgi:hypothetical protein